MKKKMLSVLLAVCLVLSMTACGGEEKDVSTDEKQDEVSVEFEISSKENEFTQNSKVEEDTKESVEENTINEESSSDVLLPNELVIPEDKAINFVGVVNEEEVSLSIEMTAIEDKESEKTYFYLDMAGIKFTTYQDGNDQYFMVDDIEMYKNILTGENMESTKEDYAIEFGINASDVTDDMIFNYLEETFAPAIGYIDASQMTEEEEMVSIENEYGLQDSDKEILVGDYDKDTCEVLEISDNNITVAYNTVYDESEVRAIVTANKENGEISYIVLKSPEELPEGAEMDMHIEFTEYDWGDIDTSWITKEGNATTEDILGRYMMDMFAYVMSMADMSNFEADATLN